MVAGHKTYRNRALWVVVCLSGGCVLATILWGIVAARQGRQTISRLELAFVAVPATVFLLSTLEVTRRGVMGLIPRDARWWYRLDAWCNRVGWIGFLLFTAVFLWVLWWHFILTG